MHCSSMSTLSESTWNSVLVQVHFHVDETIDETRITPTDVPSGFRQRTDTRQVRTPIRAADSLHRKPLSPVLSVSDSSKIPARTDKPTRTRPCACRSQQGRKGDSTTGPSRQHQPWSRCKRRARIQHPRSHMHCPETPYLRLSPSSHHYKVPTRSDHANHLCFNMRPIESDDNYERSGKRDNCRPTKHSSIYFISSLWAATPSQSTKRVRTSELETDCHTVQRRPPLPDDAS